ncbi:MAG: hypothetical protein IIZ35_07015 [Clostridia bacterium]|nr:hypothetical protein [Clostridia bacterium]
MNIITSPVRGLARNWVIINGKSSRAIKGLLIQELPPITKPKQRTRTETVDGRDGEIVTVLGYEAYNKDIKIGLYGEYDVDEVISFFNNSGEIVFSNELDKKYRFALYDEIDFDRLQRFREATVSIRCEPFKYSAVNETMQVADIRAIRALPVDYTTNGVRVTLTDDGAIKLQGTATAPTTILLETEPCVYHGLGEYEIDLVAVVVSGTASLRFISGTTPSAEKTFGSETEITDAGGTLRQTIAGRTTYDHIFIQIPTGAINMTFILTQIGVLSDFIIINRGNTTAKPKYTITATGAFDIKVNRTTICSVTMASGKPKILLDTETFSAYWLDANGVKTGFATRGITGDFSKAILQPGENIVELIPESANGVTGATITNISRWI